MIRIWIRIGSGYNWVLESRFDPDLIQIGNPDPERQKWPKKKEKGEEFTCFNVLDVVLDVVL